jgi:hypothetical protein
MKLSTLLNIILPLLPCILANPVDPVAGDCTHTEPCAILRKIDGSESHRDVARGNCGKGSVCEKEWLKCIHMTVSLSSLAEMMGAVLMMCVGVPMGLLSMEGLSWRGEYRTE